MKRRLSMLGLTIALLSCGGDDTPTGPTPGDLQVRLEGPAGAGAALLLVMGGPIDTASSEQYFTAFGPYSGTAKKVLVAGSALGGVVLRFHVPDRRTEYTAQVVEIADGGTYQLLDPAAYRAVVERP